ncbi:MAG: hypothetical protein U9Q74_16335, partial [Gemmatimonadota bacterium]|nr:hypothetical protein [Gemmatimonadota bacterium]
GWKLRSDDGREAVMDIGDWGTMIFRADPALAALPPGGPAPADTGGGRGGRAGGAGARGGGGGRGGGAPPRAVVEGFCWGIEPWNARAIEAELRKRGLDPVADNRAGGFESFHVKDPDGWDVQVSNGNARNRRVGPANAKLAEPLPFESTGWSTVWLDHLSFSVSDYKRSASFYANLLGWKPTYDEGSQHELMIGDVGDVIIRGGNPRSGAFARGGGGARIDHISFGITPWDTDGVKAELERRGLRARADTSTGDDIHVAAFKSYHTTTPNGYDLQISYVTHDNRLALPNAVRPRAPAAPR